MTAPGVNQYLAQVDVDVDGSWGGSLYCESVPQTEDNDAAWVDFVNGVVDREPGSHVVTISKVDDQNVPTTLVDNT
jgi:hypothetical protein